MPARQAKRGALRLRKRQESDDGRNDGECYYDYACKNQRAEGQGKSDDLLLNEPASAANLAIFFPIAMAMSSAGYQVLTRLAGWREGPLMLLLVISAWSFIALR